MYAAWHSAPFVMIYFDVCFVIVLTEKDLSQIRKHKCLLDSTITDHCERS